LRQVLERAVLMSSNERLEATDFALTLEMDARQEPRGETPAALPPVGTMTLDDLEKAMILKALKHHAGNISRVADALGLSRAALYRRFEKYDIQI
jgi:transcriptional regulator of acetoin/glycerol metabolism